MERVVILKNTETGQELTMPITPTSYPMAAGRGVERLDMAQTGQLALPGLDSLFTETLEVILPAQLYPYCTAGAVAQPEYYLELLSAWSRAGDVCRYIVSGAGVNAAVLLGPIESGEKDGSNDVYARIPIYEYRYLDGVLVESTQNTSRTVENNNQKLTADRYTVEKGDSLWAIAKRFYGDGSLGNKLATANNIKNPNLIYPGQVLELPEFDALEALSATTGMQTTKESAETTDSAFATIRAELGLNLRTWRAQ